MLLGKILVHWVDDRPLAVRIIETEAYALNERGSHASLGYTEKRKALFMPPGTIYMYYARGNDSFNTSCRGDGNAVLFKSGYPLLLNVDDIRRMRHHYGEPKRPVHRLSAGQTLLCKALALRVLDWRAKTYVDGKLELWDIGYRPSGIIRTSRLGIPTGRDEQLPYRFIDAAYRRYCTKPPSGSVSVETSSSFFI